MKPTYALSILPLQQDVATLPVLKALNQASRALAELKGTAKTIPNEEVLINTLIIREARDSSAVENIFTKQDELFRAEVDWGGRINPATKEVKQYVQALRLGFDRVRQQGLIRQRDLLNIQEVVKLDKSGIRGGPGTVIGNSKREIIYVPPQDRNEIERLLANLFDFINDDGLSDLDPLIKMALIHHQFESIHPFPDGNGRTGRILNILYLVQQGLLELPILYLSRFIIDNKGDYYRLLQEVRDQGNWEDWILYMLRGVETTAIQSTGMIKSIKTTMQDIKGQMRRDHPKIYTQDLLNNIFRHPYTKLQLVADELGVHINTARSYLTVLVQAGILSEHKIGRHKYFVNDRLMQILTEE